MISKTLQLFAAIGIDPKDVHINRGVANPTTVENVLHLVLGVAGAVAVLIITIAGFKYVISQGNPQEAAKAKDTIIYALVGLLIAALGYSIVSFVVKGLGL